MFKISQTIYQEQLESKQQQLKDLLSEFGSFSLEVFDSPIRNFRMRAEFRIWHKGDDAYYAMFSKEDKRPIFLDSFPYASAKINSLMYALKLAWQTNPLLKHKLFQVDFLTTLSGDSLITLYYHKKLDTKWLVLAKKVTEQLNTKIVGRAKKQKLATHTDFVQEKLNIFNQSYHYIQPENSFTQPNAQVNLKMITWVCQNLNSHFKDLLELYCGNGNFTIPISHQVRRVFATEISKLSIYALQENLILNNIENITFARLSAEELTEAIQKTRPFRRLAHIDLDDYEFEGVFVDPPRAGIDTNTCELISQFNNIIYVSCNPHSLVDNLKQLSKTHYPVKVALFDQFPYTPHMETAVLLHRR